MDFKSLIVKQKTQSRKRIARLKLKSALSKREQNTLRKEAEFLKLDCSGLNLKQFVNIMHPLCHHGAVESCKKCANIELEYGSNDQNVEMPRFGNFLSLLESEVRQEQDEMARKRLPSQNDLTRWALKDAFLAFYQGLNLPEDLVIVDNKFDDRLISQLAPDFSVIAQIWMQKLDELQRRKDKYALVTDEYDKAEADLIEGMRGSAFEKQLDRFREDVMKKLW